MRATRVASRPDLDGRHAGGRGTIQRLLEGQLLEERGKHSNFHTITPYRYYKLSVPRPPTRPLDPTVPEHHATIACRLVDLGCEGARRAAPARQEILRDREAGAAGGQVGDAQ